MSVSIAIDLLLALLNHAGQISALVAKAQAEGRSELTADEWTSITDKDNEARAALAAAISKG